ncbi:LCP family protein [Nocardia sp. IFM 10818]
MNGDEPQHNARLRREPPPGWAGRPPRPNPGPPPHAARGPRPDPLGPTKRLPREEAGPALAYSQTPPVRAPRSQPPRNQPPRPPQPQPRTRQQPPRYPDREGAPVTHAPTQQPVPYREASPPPPPVPPGRRERGGRPPREPRKRRYRFRWGRIILMLLVVLLFLPIGAAIYVDRNLQRIDVLTKYEGRPGDTPGTNWLLVGSDSRSGLTPEQEQELATGGEVGSERTDTILLVHIPESGQPTLVSLPRDSYVSIPGFGKDKLNSAFSFGGPQLLVQTVEGATGLHIDHYAQIGFSGFADVVDAVGGIDMCLDQPINDPLAGIDLPAGCQELNGANALGFVRSRATASADLDRMLNQRKFLSALLKKASSPATLANPFRAWPLIQGLTKALKVDDGDHVWHLALLGKALSGDPVATTVPIGGFTDTDVGNVLLWDKDRASRFFEALETDEPIPADLITTVGN